MRWQRPIGLRSQPAQAASPEAAPFKSECAVQAPELGIAAVSTRAEYRLQSALFIFGVKAEPPVAGWPLADPGVQNYRTGLVNRTRDGQNKEVNTPIAWVGV